MASGMMGQQQQPNHGGGQQQTSGDIWNLLAGGNWPNPGDRLSQMQQQGGVAMERPGPSDSLLPPLGGMPAQSQQQNDMQWSVPPMMPPQQMQQPQEPQAQGGSPWSGLLNPTGTFNNPNMFTRAGLGYNEGGLMGALGYLLTNMQNQKQQQPQF